MLLGDLLEEGVDDGYGKHDTSAATDGAHEIGEDAKSTDANTTEGCRDVDVASQVLDHGLLTEAFDRHLLVHKILADVTGS